MSVAECDVEETDDELCTAHMQYRPCRTCKREGEAEAAEMKADEERDERAFLNEQRYGIS